jgi:hypothetical protein
MAGRKGLVSDLERQAAEQAAPAKPPRPICRTVGCPQPAMNGFTHCQACDERIRHEAAEARCRELGLTTVAERKAYCRRMMKQSFAPPSFERWANHITQAGVDTLVRMGTKGDEQVLRRFRAMAVIDEHNELIPQEKRADVRAAIEARVRAERERIEAMLKAQGVVRREPEVHE